LLSHLTLTYEPFKQKKVLYTWQLAVAASWGRSFFCRAGKLFGKNGWDAVLCFLFRHISVGPVIASISSYLTSCGRRCQHRNIKDMFEVNKKYDTARLPDEVDF